MVIKYPPSPQLVRKVPKQFSWVDHRLVRDHYIDRCSHQAAALYLFLITVSDVKGLSYYSDFSIERRLSMEDNALCNARLELIHARLIAYKKPIYQVLALDTHQNRSFSPRKKVRVSDGRPQSVGQILKKIMEDE